MSEPRIWVLPPEVAERIAAGEVVERPASAVKELVENALDAGAGRIVVETEAGGKTLLRVTDDGQGMTPEEARLALQRHATSKLRSADDLFNIHTLGFRGEALPSIAAVSELELLTRTPDAAEGTRLLVEGGVVRAEEAAAAPVGTRVTVRRLFFNVPVREKFLRANQTEATQITEWLQKLALSRADVSFRLVHDGKEALLSPGSADPLNAVVSVLGRAVARELLRVGPESETPDVLESAARVADAFRPPVRVTGFVGRPTLQRGNRALQLFYVNGRSVRSPLLYKALDEAFRATMPHGRYPVAVLFIQVPPASVDVNVHPAKVEVRFQDEGSVYAAVLEAARNALRVDGSGLASAAEPGLAVTEPAAPDTYTPGPHPSTPFASRAIGGPAPPLPRSYVWSTHRHEPSGRGEPSSGDPPEDAAPADPQTAIDLPAPEAAPLPDPGAADDSYAAAGEYPDPGAVGELMLLGQAQDLFILAEAEGRLWIIDQHVAHERVLFDRLMQPSGPEPGEALLIPATLEVDRAHALALEEHRDLLLELGFEVEPFGPGQYALRSVPRSLLGRNYEAVFRDLADELAEQSHGGQVKLRRDEVAMAAAGRACKRAVKAGQSLGPAELERLLRDLSRAANPYTCPHGRPVFLTVEPEELARLFGGRTCE